MAEGYAQARFKWVNYHGYSFEVRPVSEGCYEIAYEEDGKEGEEIVFEFNEMDFEGLIEAMKSAVQYERAHRQGPLAGAP